MFFYFIKRNGNEKEPNRQKTASLLFAFVSLYHMIYIDGSGKIKKKQQKRKRQNWAQNIVQIGNINSRSNIRINIAREIHSEFRSRNIYESEKTNT